MSIKKISSALFTALTVVSGGITLSVLSIATPLIQSAQAAYYQDCPFTAKIYQRTRIRPNPNTYTPEVGWLEPGQTVQFSTFVNGESILDQSINKWDPMWFKLSDGRGYVASAVVQGYPPTSPCPTPQPSIGLPTTVGQSNPYFKLQFRHPQYNPTGPSSSLNCGPASLAMALAALKLEPSGLSIQQSIDRANKLMNKSPNTITYFSDLEIGIRAAGRKPENISTWAALDSALQAQKPVILNGYLNNNWRNQFPVPSNVGSGTIAHLNAVLGKASNGNYLVADPMHRGAVVEMSRQKLAVFFSLQGQNGNPWGRAVGK